MTPGELARVPEGGWHYRHFKTQKQPFAIYGGGTFICDCFTEKEARQIVGSVNATIISNMIRAEPNLRNMLELDKDRHFWLDYSKGENA